MQANEWKGQGFGFPSPNATVSHFGVLEPEESV